MYRISLKNYRKVCLCFLIYSIQFTLLTKFKYHRLGKLITDDGLERMQMEELIAYTLVLP
jgi:hypothetical protein